MLQLSRGQFAESRFEALLSNRNARYAGYRNEISSLGFIFARAAVSMKRLQSQLPCISPLVWLLSSRLARAKCGSCFQLTMWCSAAFGKKENKCSRTCCLGTGKTLSFGSIFKEDTRQERQNFVSMNRSFASYIQVRFTVADIDHCKSGSHSPNNIMFWQELKLVISDESVN